MLKLLSNFFFLLHQSQTLRSALLAIYTPTEFDIYLCIFISDDYSHAIIYSFAYINISRLNLF